MTLQQRIEAFVSLGKFLMQFQNNNQQQHPLNANHFDSFENLIQNVAHSNAWFNPDMVRYSISSIANMLSGKNIEQWITQYDIPDNQQPKTIAVIMAGNVPLVGFHDLLCVLITGNRFLGKLSSKDDKLMKYITLLLTEINPEFEQRITFTDQVIRDFDAVIATGSNNSSRYFDYYFGKYPNIIRTNRNSAAVLSGNETSQQFHDLGADIFTYFGLGCRNVSKLYVPAGYEFIDFFDAIQPYKYVIDHFKYANNYDYNKSIYLVNRVTHLDNGFLLLKEDTALASPVSCLFYEHYTDVQLLNQSLQNDNRVQCVVGYQQALNFGQAQNPMLGDYADNIDTIAFLLNLQRKL